MIAIRRAVIDALIRHAREALPNECCGLLIGTGERIDEAVPARNLKESPTAYLVDPERHFEVLRRTRREGTSIVGAYHSHTRSAAVPSPRDLGESHDPDLVHVIVSLEREPADVRAYYLTAGAWREVVLMAM